MGVTALLDAAPDPVPPDIQGGVEKDRSPVPSNVFLASCSVHQLPSLLPESGCFQEGLGQDDTTSSADTGPSPASAYCLWPQTSCATRAVSPWSWPA